MKSKVLIGFSAMALLVALWHDRSARPIPSPSSGSAGAVPVLPAVVSLPVSVEQARAGEVQPHAITTAPFHWSQIESTNYHTYLGNLRAIGCPEATIRDIITADVHALYRQRRMEARGVEHGEYWRSSFAGSTRVMGGPDASDAEEQAVLETLLGAQPEAAEAASQTSLAGEPAASLDRWLDGLSEPTQNLLREDWQRLASTKAPLLRLSEQRPLTQVEEAQLAELEQEQARVLNASLTPEERDEFELRNSPLADDLRSTLDGMDVGEAEFRQLFNASRERERQLTAAVTDEATAVAWQEYAQAVRGILGAEDAATLLAQSELDAKRPASQLAGQ